MSGLSVAGARAGLAGERSGLFTHQIRIIKEMRDADKRRGRTGVAVRPRFSVWENVLGAYSSGQTKGSDFREVIQAFFRIEEPQADVIRPAAGRWEYAGILLGVRSCVAWTTWNAEYFGVPQTRRRIFLVADHAGFSPIKILFEQESVPGDSASGKRAGQALARGAEDSSDDTGWSTQEADGQHAPAVSGVPHQPGGGDH